MSSKERVVKLSSVCCIHLMCACVGSQAGGVHQSHVSMSHAVFSCGCIQSSGVCKEVSLFNAFFTAAPEDRPAQRHPESCECLLPVEEGNRASAMMDRCK